VEIQWSQGPNVHQKVLEWRNKSDANGHRWVVSLDEPWVSPSTNLNEFRRYDVWGSYIAGASGSELFQDGDGQIDDFHPYQSFYSTQARAREFLQNNAIPYVSMEPADGIVSGVSAYALATPGQIYVVYLPSGGSATLDLTGQTGVFGVSWFDPRNGGDLQIGSVTNIQGEDARSLGQPPNNPGSDWVALIRSTGAKVPKAPTDLAVQ